MKIWFPLKEKLFLTSAWTDSKNLNFFGGGYLRVGSILPQNFSLNDPFFREVERLFTKLGYNEECERPYGQQRYTSI